MLNTPGFDKVDFSNLHLTLGGGMAVQRAVAERWKQVTGCILTQAWGLTETSPVASVNLPQPATLDSKVYVQPSSRRGSTGKLAPGMAALFMMVMFGFL